MISILLCMLNITSLLLLFSDFNDLKSLQAASGNAFGLGNMGLPNNGFPMNAYERKRARQDVNTLTALGVIDGPEEAGPYSSFVRSNRPDPPDNPGGKDGGGNNKPKAGKKSKAKGKSKKASKNKEVTVKTKVQSVNSQNINNPQLKQDRKIITEIKGRQGVALKTIVNEVEAAQMAKTTMSKQKLATATVPKHKLATATVPKQKLATEVVKARPHNYRTGAGKVNNRKVWKGGVKKSKKRKTKRRGRNNGEWGDPGEGRLAEQGEMPLKTRGKRVLWRSGGEDAQIGRGEMLDRRLFVGRF